MLETLDMEKLQKIVYYINSVKMTVAQRDELHRFVIEGILVGEVDTDDVVLRSREVPEPEIARFIEPLLETEFPLEWVKAQELYNSYVMWCEENSVEVEANATFAAALIAAGVKRKKRADANYYLVSVKKEAAL